MFFFLKKTQNNTVKPIRESVRKKEKIFNFLMKKIEKKYKKKKNVISTCSLVYY